MVEYDLAKVSVGVRFPLSAPFVKIVGTTDVEIKLNSFELSFFVFKKGCDDMSNIIKSTRQILKYNVYFYLTFYLA